MTKPDNETILLLWAWLRAIYMTLNEEQKKQFAENLAKEIALNVINSH